MRFPFSILLYGTFVFYAISFFFFVILATSHEWYV